MPGRGAGARLREQDEQRRGARERADDAPERAPVAGAQRTGFFAGLAVACAGVRAVPLQQRAAQHACARSLTAEVGCREMS